MARVAGKRGPRDFYLPDETGGGRMFLGTALHLINMALHPEGVDPEDLFLPGPFFQGWEPNPPGQSMSREEYLRAYLRAADSRRTMLGWLRRGKIESFWLDEDGHFRRVNKRAWGWNPRSARVIGFTHRHNRHASVTEAALARFGLAPKYFETIEPGELPRGARFLYVRPDQVRARVQGINPRAYFPEQPRNTLSGFADRSLSEVQDLSLLAALTWISTRDESATLGAVACPDFYRRKFSDEIAYDAAHLLVQDQVVGVYCRCREPVCKCWSGAVRELSALAGTPMPSLVAHGYRNNEGDEENIPPAAWRGAPSYDSTCWLEPPRPNGTRWGGVSFFAMDIFRAFPPLTLEQSALPVSVTKLKPDEAGVRDLAKRFDEDGIAIRSVTAALISKMWDARYGPSPKRDAVTALMAGGKKGRRASSP